MYDVIVIGAGPSGMSASIYLKRNNKSVLVIEKNSYGGQIINTLSIENYPAVKDISGFDFATNLYNQTKALGAEYKFETVTSIKNNKDYKEVITNKNTYKCKSIIIATGAYNRLLGVSGEKEFTSKGVSYCATCDGHFYKSKVVAVVGGGNTAIEDALYLSDLVSKVYVIIRRDEFRADRALVDKLLKTSNIEVIYNSNVTLLNGNERFESIVVTNKEGNNSTIKIDGLFIAIGRSPESENFNDLIATNENGYIIAGENCHTNIDGIFVAGDVRNKSLRQLVTATSDGAIAAQEAIKYVNNL